MHGVIILVRSDFNHKSEYHLQVYLDGCLYKLADQQTKNLKNITQFFSFLIYSKGRHYIK